MHEAGTCGLLPSWPGLAPAPHRTTTVKPGADTPRVVSCRTGCAPLPARATTGLLTNVCPLPPKIR